MQRFVIHYDYIGDLNLPEVEKYLDSVMLGRYQGVAVGYLVGKTG